MGGAAVESSLLPALPRQRTASRMLVVVANRLPVEHDDEDGWVRSPGGLVTALESVLAGRESVWVGWSGRFSDAPDVFGGAAMPDRMGDCELVDVQQSEADGKLYYDGFCNSTLWPLYHDTVVPPAYHRKQFEAYRRVNQRFADHVALMAAPGATVWVHDYQLQLVPAMLRAQRPDLTIAYFLHIPFPPAELFQQLPWRKQVLEGLLGSDLVGFQTDGGARNFLSLCERLLGLEVDEESVVVPTEQGGRRVRAGGFPISIDSAAVDALAATPAVQERAHRLREELGDPELLLLGVDRLDYTKGIDIRHEGVRRAVRGRAPRGRQRGHGAGGDAQPRDDRGVPADPQRGRADRRSRDKATVGTRRRRRRSTTCTRTCRARSWPRCTWPPTSCWSRPCATA